MVSEMKRAVTVRLGVMRVECQIQHRYSDHHPLRQRAGRGEGVIRQLQG